MDEPITQFFLASQFKDVHVVLDNNYFVSSRFEGVTFQWRGGPLPLVQRNSYGRCILELPKEINLPQNSELLGKCQLIRKTEVTYEVSSVGLPMKWRASGCVTKNPDGTIKLTAGGECGKDASIMGPAVKP